MKVLLRCNETLVVIIIKEKVFCSWWFDITVLVLDTARSAKGCSSVAIPNLYRLDMQR